jgi:hypothetical protein
MCLTKTKIYVTYLQFLYKTRKEVFQRHYLHGLKSNTERLKEQQQKHGRARTSVYHETHLYPATTKML